MGLLNGFKGRLHRAARHFRTSERPSGSAPSDQAVTAPELRQTRIALRDCRASAKMLRDAPLQFWHLEPLGQVECACCGAKPSHISAYPFHASPQFARQIILWCEKCGFGMVPGTSFDLDHYYRRQYAVENRGDRQMSAEEYFRALDSGSPPKQMQRYVNRARRQVALIKEYVPSIGAMLDIGAGPGYALSVSGAAEKYAVEHDEHSKKYLDHLDVRLLDWENVGRHSYDAILLSHSLEHFQHSDVAERLGALLSSLRKGGVMFIEVPPGGLAWKLYDYKHEPHTLFFTLEALQRLGERIGGEVLFCRPTNKTYARISDRTDTIYVPPRRDHLDDPRGGLTLILGNPA